MIDPVPLPARALWLVTGLASLPHLPRLPTALLPLWALILAWAWWLGGHSTASGRIQRWLRLGLTALAGLGLLLTQGTLFGQQAGSSLLVLLAALKLTELQRPRDGLLVVFLGFFLVTADLLFDTGLAHTLYAGGVTLALVAVWIRFSGPLPLKDLLRRTAGMLAAALPVMLVLFLLFPRIPGPLWRLPGDAGRAVTGLSEEMTVGAISELARSEAVAFRVRFEGPMPPPVQRYWRGPVLELTDGRRWQAVGERVTLPALRPTGPVYHYRILPEPGPQRWLLALDRPLAAPDDATLSENLELRLAAGSRDGWFHRLQSQPDHPGPALTVAQRFRNLALPRSLSPRVRALARQWQRSARDPRDIIAAALRLFREQPFVYSLRPPPLDRAADPTDAFLFRTRTGFCEHFAAAFTLLMRAAGLPARVVTGYQGGEFNPVGGYLVVRQSDAHAWSEVWIEGEGWVRVDPTAAVAPERIEYRIDAATAGEGRAVGFLVAADDWLVRGWQTLGHFADSLAAGWDAWVLGYGPERQRALLARLGLEALSWSGLGRLLAITLGLALLVTSLWVLRRRPPADPLARLERRFQRRLAPLGLERGSAEGPLAQRQRILARRPDLAAEATAIIELLAAERYGPAPDPARLAVLRRLIADFRPRRRAPTPRPAA